ncbi:ATP-dependent DNA helicase DDX11-like, partial [Uloborus diversus]|uniref:ATP-dependent DNA helicase DDX11-like n=1 Tax=Uloborus diversus TaxID=327109 RepID=UPI002409FEEF
MAEIHFPFPFPPYDVQEDFMRNLYTVLDEQKVGIFESPTGTGKSLSIICGSFKWLKDFREQRLKELQDRLNEKINEEGDDWFNDFLHKQEKSHSLLDAKEEYAFLVENEERLKKIRAKNKRSSYVQPVSSNLKRKHSDIEDDKNLDDDFIISQEEESEELEVEQKDKKHVLKIYFASRTHSQLAQFIGEVKRSPYKDNITVTALGSRLNFCINETVSKLKYVSLINESCTELQRQKSKGKKCCPYMKNFDDMQDDILSAVKDIEEIVTQGQKLHSCPYYATRKVIPDVEVVVLPYNILLHKPTRDTYGIVLKNNIVIIDEAHNLIESINGMYSSEINGACLEQTFWQVDAYRKCYSSRLSQKNLKYIKLVCFVLKAFINGLKLSNVENQKPSSEMVTYNDFITVMGVGHINFFELVKYCDETLIAHKIHGFTAAKVAKGITPLDDQTCKTTLPQKSATASFLSLIKETKNIGKDKAKEINLKEVIELTKNSDMQYKPSAIFSFIEFLKTLTFPTEDGRIILNRSTSMKESYLKFLHLNPASHFKDVVSEARSLILAGGTMQPISEFENLFINAGVPREKISYFTCGHVIPPENLLAVGLANGPCESPLDFTFKNRQLPQTVKEIGSVLLNVCNAVRGGVVCFFPSYDYEQFIFLELKKSKLLEAIGKKKKLFREPKFSSDVDRVLTDYAKCISLSSAGKNSFNGAILFSIVGGKMSEGINFSDNLGRCVIMVGLPYPNKYSVELKEKMAYLNKTCKSRDGKSAGDIYYNNLCMKAVNQSIGRAIRHKNDYACILLLDYRYNHTTVKNSLPQWILKSFSFHEKFGSAIFSMRK